MIRRTITWTEKAVRDVIKDIEETKKSLQRCHHCRSCSKNEICDVAISDATGLLQEYGWDQAFHLANDGINRLWLRNEIKVKEIKRSRTWSFRRRKKFQSRRIIAKT
ncbi:MAG: hypothetical protein ACE5I5_05735 [Candidatus Heimdallarchaeota archaeon]